VGIAAEEAAKAKRLMAVDLDQKGKELSDLQAVLQKRDEKLAEAQKAQADLIRKQRELGDAKRELDEADIGPGYFRFERVANDPLQRNIGLHAAKFLQRRSPILNT
jgi:hypothetical protein